MKALAAKLGIEDRVVFSAAAARRSPALLWNRRRVRLPPPVHAAHRTRDAVEATRAMAQGRLLVASDVGGQKELIATARPAYCSGPATRLRWPTRRAGCWPARLLAAAWDQGRRFVEQERTWETSVAGSRGIDSRLASARGEAVRPQNRTGRTAAAPCRRHGQSDAAARGTARARRREGNAGANERALSSAIHRVPPGVRGLFRLTPYEVSPLARHRLRWTSYTSWPIPAGRGSCAPRRRDGCALRGGAVRGQLPRRRGRYFPGALRRSRSPRRCSTRRR